MREGEGRVYKRPKMKNFFLFFFINMIRLAELVDGGAAEQAATPEDNE